MEFIERKFTFKDWSGHGHFSDKVYFSIQVLICALGNIWGCGWGNPVWLAEAATNHFLLRFPPAIMPKYSKFSNSQKFMIFGLSNIPWPQWHKELTDGLSSKKSTKASIKHIWNILEYFYKNLQTSLNDLFVTFFSDNIFFSLLIYPCVLLISYIKPTSFHKYTFVMCLKKTW